VLIVEHDARLRLALGEALRVDGLDVAAAADGLEALYDLGGPTAAVVLDMDVPRVSGHRVYTLLRRDPQTRDLPVVLLSEESFDEHFDTMRSLPAPESFLTKPVLAEEVASEVRRVLQLTSIPSASTRV
jgi:CheY-like chemotaxis protein